MSFSQYIAQISSSLENPSLDNLDLVTAFYLGLKEVNPNSSQVEELGKKIHALHTKKIALKFLDRLIVVSGSNNLTPATKEKAIEDGSILPLLTSVNVISGKVDATPLLQPFADQLYCPTFHEEFLEYEASAHHAVVGALISRLEPVVEKMAYGLPTVQPSKKNTLKNLYHGGNTGKTFISIDLRRANWSALRHWDPTLPCWDNFLATHLPNGQLKPLFAASKNFRQVTLGVALKKHGAVKMVEATQVMLIKEATAALVKKFGQPFSESNDEVIFEWRQRPGYPLEKWLTTTLSSPLFRITQFCIREKTHDECYVIDYHELSADKKYTLLRCATPEKVEARLK